LKFIASIITPKYETHTPKKEIRHIKIGAHNFHRITTKNKYAPKTHTHLP
jgi:hypothetical protein